MAPWAQIFSWLSRENVRLPGAAILQSFKLGLGSGLDNFLDVQPPLDVALSSAYRPAFSSILKPLVLKTLFYQRLDPINPVQARLQIGCVCACIESLATAF